MNENFKDKTGRALQVGDYIVYGHGVGRSHELRFGKVLQIKAKEKNRPYDTGAAITIIGANDPDWKADKPYVRDKARVGTIRYPERTVIVNDTIPKAYKTALDSFKWSGNLTSQQLAQQDLE